MALPSISLGGRRQTNDSELIESIMLQGVYPAIFTPFDDDLNVDFEMLSEIIEYQLGNGVDGFFVTGSTGEGLLLSLDERMAVIKHVTGQTAGRGKIIAHVGHPSSQAAAAMAVKSEKAGVDWVASVAPIYHGTTFEGAMRHYRQIATATELPFMVYCLGAEIVPERDAKLFEIPNVSGLKYTNSNYFSVQGLVEKLDRPISLLNGMDEHFIASLTFGFTGGIGSTYNFAPKFYVDILRHFQNGEWNQAMELQARINRVTRLMIRYENWSYRKAIMRYIGFDCGPCRPPYSALTENEYQEFAALLEQLGVLSPVSPSVS